MEIMNKSVGSLNDRVVVSLENADSAEGSLG